jgi:hypothetical protein
MLLGGNLNTGASASVLPVACMWSGIHWVGGNDANALGSVNPTLAASRLVLDAAQRWRPGNDAAGKTWTGNWSNAEDNKVPRPVRTVVVPVPLYAPLENTLLRM